MFYWRPRRSENWLHWLRPTPPKLAPFLTAPNRREENRIVECGRGEERPVKYPGIFFPTCRSGLRSWVVDVVLRKARMSDGLATQ